MTTPDNLNALPAGYRLQDYTIVSVLGVGGFGITYLATDAQLGLKVAIKEYLPNTLAVRGGDSVVLPKSRGDERDYRWGLDRFMQEAQTLARFRHPAIVRVLRYFEANGTGYTVMEYEAGQSLAQYLRSHPAPRPEPEVLELLLPLLDGLQQVHAAGFLHRDIKPGNIYLRQDGSPLLLDFGSARQSLGTHTQSLTTVFTPGYAPFEQYFAEGKQGPWTDIYALGAVLYRLMSGDPPPDAARRVHEDTLKPVTILGRGRYSAGFLHAVDMALSRDAAERPQNIDAWRDLLVSTQTTQATSAVPPAIAEAPTVTLTPVATPVHATAPEPAVPHTATRRRPARKKKGGALKTLALVVVAVLVVGGLAKHLKQRRAHALAAAPTEISVASTRTETGAETRAKAGPEAGAAGQGTTRPAAHTAMTPPRNPPPAGTGADRFQHALDARFAEADRNGDGYLSREEAGAAFPRLARLFGRLDRNHDGRLSELEIERLLQAERNQAFNQQR